jgi:hypothetical protein
MHGVAVLVHVSIRRVTLHLGSLLMRCGPILRDSTGFDSPFRYTQFLLAASSVRAHMVFVAATSRNSFSAAEPILLISCVPAPAFHEKPIRPVAEFAPGASYYFSPLSSLKGRSVRTELVIYMFWEPYAVAAKIAKAS